MIHVLVVYLNCFVKNHPCIGHISVRFIKLSKTMPLLNVVWVLPQHNTVYKHGSSVHQFLQASQSQINIIFLCISFKHREVLTRTSSSSPSSTSDSSSSNSILFAIQLSSNLEKNVKYNTEISHCDRLHHPFLVDFTRLLKQTLSDVVICK
uniref:Uncharacterized protein n=1 Tax=Noccaea caerulescens TaxID=107243 RepID=A0A1J3JLP7_NOCCA